MRPKFSRRIAPLLLLLAAGAAASCHCFRSARAQGVLPAPSAYDSESTTAPTTTLPTNPQAQSTETSTDNLVAKVLVVGNETISTAQISGNLTTRVGRPFDQSTINGDVRRLMTLGWFVDVRTKPDSTPAGLVVTYHVTERPTIRYVNYFGNEKVKDKKLAKETGLEVGGSVDPYAVEEGRRKIQEYYVGRGYNNVQVTVLEGSKHTDKGVTYLIHEGEAAKIWSIKFEGNEFFSDGTLKKYIKSKPPILKLFKGYVDRTQIEADEDRLTAFYRSFGFFQAKVGVYPKYNKDRDWMTLSFIIEEGPRYNVRQITFYGNTKFEPAGVRENLELQAGQPFEQAHMQKDQLWLQELYGSHGYVFANIRPETVFLEEPGEVDLVYHIDEGRQFRVGRIFVHIGGDNPHTRKQTALNRLTLRPGDVMDTRELKASERRLVASSLFHSDAATGVRPKITYRIPDDVDVAQTPQSSAGNIRGQEPPSIGPPVLPPPHAPQLRGFQHGMRRIVVSQQGDVHVYCDDYEHYRRWVENESTPTNEAGSDGRIPRQPSRSLKHKPDGAAPNTGVGGHSAQDVVVRGQSPVAAPADDSQLWWRQPRKTSAQQRRIGPYQSIRGQSPQASANSAYSNLDPSQYASRRVGGQVVRPTGPESATLTPPSNSPIQQAQYSTQISPPAGPLVGQPADNQGPLPPYTLFPDGRYGLPGEPYPADRVDIYVEGQETQTGRLMLGVGINSDAGVVGNIVVDERNFNWRRFPTSWEDLRSGAALRGGGQRFRIDASPGSRVNRYLVSWQNPYLFDRPVSLGLSGSYYDRRYRDWDEQRLGGRISLGHQWVERDFAGTVSYRGENVNIHDPSVTLGTVPQLDEAIGDNVLHGFKLTLINDTRDSAFLATQGHYLELGGEQVIGTFDYPRVTLDARKFFLLHERPDHSGRHVLSVSSNVGYSGTHTPIYEHFFAGGFSTLRGFDFRGASPIEAGVEVGGEFQWISSVQYLFPVTADDMLHGVVFCDFGTVEQDVTIRDFRVSPGVGLRITVPAMGPAPIALDFAFPVVHADFDDREVFSFSMGFGRF